MKVYAITKMHELWEKAIRYADGCSWSAGKNLAERMRNDQILDRQRVFVALMDDKIVGFCTFTEKDVLSDEYDLCSIIPGAQQVSELQGRSDDAILSNQMGQPCFIGLVFLMKAIVETGFRKYLSEMYYPTLSKSGLIMCF